MKKRTFILAWFRGLVVTTWLLASAFRMGYPDGNEYSIKSMFLLNFMKYVEWPVENSTGTFRIGVVGDSEISDALAQMISQKASESRKIEIVKISANSVPYCQMVFISHSASGHIDDWIKKTSGKGVLIVTEEYKSGTANGGINLLTVDNKIRFEIYQSALRMNNLKVSSRLTELAINIR